MAKRQNETKISVPAIETDNHDEENTTMQHVQENVIDQPVENTQDQPASDNDQESNDLVTLEEIEAYTPDAIEQAIAETTQNHKTVETLINSKLPEEMIKATRDALGISDSLENDIADLRAKLGGRVAQVIEKLRANEEWTQVLEYVDLLDLVSEINNTRTMLGLPLLIVRTGGKQQGAAKSVDGIVSTNNRSGFMKTGIHEYKLGQCLTKWTVTPDHIAVQINGTVVYTGKQGERSLSEILNRELLKHCGLKPRLGFPKFLRDNGINDPSTIMLHSKPEK